MKTPVFKRATCGLISLKAWPEKVSVCATPAGPGRRFLPRGREAGRAEGEHRVTRSCVLSGGWSISPLQQTLSVSCHERGALYFVDKEAEKQLSKGEKQTRDQRSISPEEKEPRCLSRRSNTLGDCGFSGSGPRRFTSTLQTLQK